MTIREVAQLTGLSHQAIYKRLKAHGVKLETLKDKATGQFTPEGEAAILELFNLDKPVEKEVATDVEKLRNRITELENEVEKLRNQVATLEDERNFLRQTVEREQQLQGMALSKLPTPPPALPPTEEEKKKRRSWWSRMRGKGKDDA